MPLILINVGTKEEHSIHNFFFIYAGAGPPNRLRNTASDNLFINVDQRCGDGAALFGRSREKGAAPAPALRLKLQL